MMNKIDNKELSPSIQPASDKGDALDFNKKVLNYLQMQQPDDNLGDLLNQLRALSPDKAVTQQQLYSALLSADGYMRKDENYQDYTNNTLDELTFRMIGLNMLYNKAMNDMMKSTSLNDDEQSFL